MKEHERLIVASMLNKLKDVTNRNKEMGYNASDLYRYMEKVLNVPVTVETVTVNDVTFKRKVATLTVEGTSYKVKIYENAPDQVIVE